MYLKINTSTELLSFTEEIISSKVKWLAIDTEFERRNTYFPALSLIQFATPNQTWVIDALAEIDLKPLQQILENPNILKVLHAGDQDFDALNYKLGFKINPFIDTQVMATFASMGKALSLEKLALYFLDIQMDKTLQNSNWLYRPLSEAQILYAARDAEYIAKIYPLLNDKLTKLKRLDWVMHEMQILFNKYAKPVISREWLKFCKPKLNFNTYLHAYVLVNWREKIARNTDTAKPLVIPNHLLEYMIESKKHKNYSEKFCSPKYLQDFLDTWLSIKELSNNYDMHQQIEQEVAEHFAIIPANDAVILGSVNGQVQSIANELNIPADMMLNKKQKLNAIKTNGESLTGWRKQIFGNLFINIADNT